MSENLTTNVELDSTANGTVSFATDVVATIAGLAATEVEGVAAMINNGNLGLVDMLRRNQGNRPLTRGVKVEINGNQVTVQLTVTVDYGSPVPTVAREIQDNVKKAIETMTGLEVPEINVYVQGISFEKENRAAMELEQKQRAAISAQRVERLGRGEEPHEDKPETEARDEEPAETERRKKFRSSKLFSQRRSAEEHADETASDASEQDKSEPIYAPAPASESQAATEVESAPAAEAAPEAEAAAQPENDAPAAIDADPDEDEQVCDGHCETCTLKCEAAGDDGASTDGEAARTDDDKRADE